MTAFLSASAAVAVVWRAASVMSPHSIKCWLQRGHCRDEQGIGSKEPNSINNYLSRSTIMGVSASLAVPSTWTGLAEDRAEVGEPAEEEVRPRNERAWHHEFDNR